VTDDQKAQIKAIAAAHRPVLRNLHVQLREANQRPSDALLATGDPTASVQLISQIRGDLLAQTVKMRQGVLGVLDPDHRARAAELQVQPHALRAERHNLLMGGTPSAQ
jgi:hypothetical protein